MASVEDKFSENEAGKYYVDGECAFCETCIELAPENFASQNDEYAYVKKQPENDTEEEQCQEAMESCPSDAIGDDGE
jgi:ferredoxin